MGAVFAFLPIWTEPSHVEWTYPFFAYVSVRTQRSKRTEPTVIMRARRAFRGGFDVLVHTVVSVRTCSISRIIVTFWHPSNVEFVKEFAVLAFLA
jgi:hypothetical protein